MSLEHAILGFLSTEDLTGYDLKTRCFDRSAIHFWTADQGQVYRTLEKLERNGLVTARLRTQRGKPDRKVYSITARGTESLSDWLSGYHSPPPIRDPFLMQLYFLSEVNVDDRLEVLRRVRDEHQRRLEGVRTRTAEPPLASDVSQPALVTRRMTLDGVAYQERATIDWLDDCIERLRAEERAS